MTALLNHTILFGVPETIISTNIVNTHTDPHILLNNEYLVNNKQNVIHIKDFCKKENIYLYKLYDMWFMFDNDHNDIFVILNQKLHIIPGADIIKNSSDVLISFTHLLNNYLKDILKGHITKELLRLFNDILIYKNIFNDFIIFTIDEVWVIYNKSLQTLLFVRKDYNDEDNVLDYIYKFDGVKLTDNYNQTISEYLLSIINQIITKNFIVFGAENVQTTYHLTKTLLVKVPSVVDNINKIKELERMVSTYQN